MRRRYLRVALLVGLVLLAGCAGGNGVPTESEDGTPMSTTSNPESITSGTPGTATPTASNQPSPSPDFSRSQARELAMESEKKRIKAHFANISGIPRVSTGIYGEMSTEIIRTTETSYVVSVTMSYSYEYNCDGQSGAIDGLQTVTVYEVTEANATLRSVEKRIQSAC
ncbi:MAG: hypothetical protein ABEH81_10965 [Halopenitus sp.]